MIKRWRRPVCQNYNPSTATVEQVAEWAGLLEVRLTNLRNQPLLLFFDEMEWWVGVPDAQQPA